MESRKISNLPDCLELERRKISNLPDFLRLERRKISYLPGCLGLERRKISILSGCRAGKEEDNLPGCLKLESIPLFNEGWGQLSAWQSCLSCEHRYISSDY